MHFLAVLQKQRCCFLLCSITYLNSHFQELGLYYHTETECYYYYSDEKKIFVFHSYPDRSSSNAALLAHEKRKAKKHKMVSACYIVLFCFIKIIKICTSVMLLFLSSSQAVSTPKLLFVEQSGK